MLATWLRTPVVVVTAAVVATMLTGCGDDDDESTDSMYLGHAEVAGPGRGLSEWSGEGGGGRRVMQVADPEVDAEPPASRTVTTLVEICAPDGRPVATSGSDWRLLLEGGGLVDASGGPQPTNHATPTIAESGRVEAGQCAFADIDFAVPEGSLSVGMVYRAPNDELIRWSWFPNEAQPADA
jgi:hypothetical protein